MACVMPLSMLGTQCFSARARGQTQKCHVWRKKSYSTNLLSQGREDYTHTSHVWRRKLWSKLQLISKLFKLKLTGSVVVSDLFFYEKVVNQTFCAPYAFQNCCLLWLSYYLMCTGHQIKKRNVEIIEHFVQLKPVIFSEAVKWQEIWIHTGPSLPAIWTWWITLHPSSYGLLCLRYLCNFVWAKHMDFSVQVTSMLTFVATISYG